jgi:hypothetical protein
VFFVYLSSVFFSSFLAKGGMLISHLGAYLLHAPGYDEPPPPLPPLKQPQQLLLSKSLPTVEVMATNSRNNGSKNSIVTAAMLQGTGPEIDVEKERHDEDEDEDEDEEDLMKDPGEVGVLLPQTRVQIVELVNNPALNGQQGEVRGRVGMDGEDDAFKVRRLYLWQSSFSMNACSTREFIHDGGGDAGVVQCV